MELLAFLQHRDEGRQTPGPGLRFFRGLNAPDDGVAVDAIELGEERLGFWTALELGLQLRRYRSLRRRIVGGVPAAIALRAIDLRQSGGSHRSAVDQGECFFAIDLGPHAALSTRDESLQPGCVALRFFQRVDPTVAERDVESLGVGHRFDLRALLGDARPDTRHSRVVLFEPGVEISSRPESLRRLGGLRFFTCRACHVRVPRPVCARCRGRTRRRSACFDPRDLLPPAPARRECCRGRAAPPRRRSRRRQPLPRGGGTGVTSRSVLPASSARTRTTTAVMLSFPPLTLASWISASTILSGLARDISSCWMRRSSTMPVSPSLASKNASPTRASPPKTSGSISSAIPMQRVMTLLCGWRLACSGVSSPASTCS